MQTLAMPTTSRRPLALLLLGALLLLSAATAATIQAQPQFFETVLHLQQPVVNVSSIDRVIYRWSTHQQDGTVGEFALEDLTLELHTPTGDVFRDRIVVNGVAQPLSDIPRIIGHGNDIFWRFNLSTSTLEQMRNVSESVIMTSTGLHFDVHDSISIPVDGRVSVKSYIDGQNQDPHTDQLNMQMTTPMVFFDDFETGNLTAWTSAVP